MPLISAIHISLRHLRDRLFPAVIKAVFWFIPIRFWFSSVRILGTALSPVYDFCRAEAHYWAYNKRLKKGWLLCRLLEILTETGREFSIPYTLEGESALQGICEQRKVFVCTAHLPFANLIGRAFYELGLQVPQTVAANSPIPGAFPVFGKPNVTSRFIKADKYSLVKARRALATGSVLVMIDSGLEAYSTNMFRLAAKAGIRTVFAFPELDDHNGIVISFKTAPYPVCHTDSEIAANLQSFDAELIRLRQSDAKTSAPPGMSAESTSENSDASSHSLA